MYSIDEHNKIVSFENKNIHINFKFINRYYEESLQLFVISMTPFSLALKCYSTLSIFRRLTFHQITIHTAEIKTEFFMDVKSL